MKKKVLFVIPEHAHGGTNKSLQNLLLLLDHDKYDLSVFCMFPGGPYEEVFCSYAIGRSCAFELLLNNCVRRFFQKADMILGYRLSRILFKYETNRIQQRGSFDIVVGFQEGITTRFCSFFSGVSTIAWVQCDYSYYLKIIKHPFRVEQQAYNTFDKIVCVSKCTADVMKDIYPEFADKVSFVYNTLDISFINELSLEPIDDKRYHEDKIFKLVSVGRINKVKRFDHIPQIARKILDIDRNLKFCWYIIGDGREKDKADILQDVKRVGVEDNVVLLGAKDNPYPYIRQSQLLVCLSMVESWSYVINEAKLLHIPVLSTNFPAAYEVVERGCGMICKIEMIPETLASLIADENAKYSEIKTCCNAYQYSNASIINKIENEFL